jgi:hypothetical protein
MTDHDRVVTPYTDPNRWTEAEKALFEQGKCSWVVEYGNFGGVVHCGEPSKAGASFGHCADHEADLLELHWPDGTPRPLR